MPGQTEQPEPELSERGISTGGGDSPKGNGKIGAVEPLNHDENLLPGHSGYPCADYPVGSHPPVHTGGQSGSNSEVIRKLDSISRNITSNIEFARNAYKDLVVIGKAMKTWQDELDLLRLELRKLKSD